MDEQTTSGELRALASWRRIAPGIYEADIEQQTSGGGHLVRMLIIREKPLGYISETAGTSHAL